MLGNHAQKTLELFKVSDIDKVTCISYNYKEFTKAFAIELKILVSFFSFFG
jgi:hypothetical protein